jgi:hypothetical protein
MRVPVCLLLEQFPAFRDKLQLPHLAVVAHDLDLVHIPAVLWLAAQARVDDTPWVETPDPSDYLIEGKNNALSSQFPHVRGGAFLLGDGRARNKEYSD